MTITLRKIAFFILSLLFITSVEISHAETNLGKTEIATFAAGCFWCTQSDFDKIPGVIKTTAGYTGGQVLNPTYAQVSNGGTGHYESVQVVFDPDKISYQQLLNVFWRNVDPTDASGQFCDKGEQYQGVIFYHDETQKKLALQSKEELIKSKRFSNIVTKILPAETFYPAEEYHQKYSEKNPIRYHFYRYNCGRDQRLKELWGS